MDDRFQKAEHELDRLKDQLSGGRISQEQFDNALKQLMLQDAQGRWWMMGADTGKWYIHDGQNWVLANPGSVDASPPIPSIAAPVPGSVPQKSRSLKLPLLISVAGLLLCCLLGGLGFIVVSRAGIVKLGFLNPTPTIFFVLPPVIIPTITPIKPTDLSSSSGAPTPILPTAAPSPIVLPTVAELPTRISISPTPPISILPGLYVTGLRTEPTSLGERMDAGFVATFLNSTGAPQRYRWLVYVYKADNFKNSFGETASENIDILAGTSERKTYGTWRIGVGTCGDYVARVAWQDESKRPTFFTKVDGQLFELPFKVCP